MTKKIIILSILLVGQSFLLSSFGDARENPLFNEEIDFDADEEKDDSRSLEERMSRKISLDLRDMAIKDVMNFLSIRGRFHLSSNVQIKERATFYLPGVSIGDALNLSTLAAQTAYKIEDNTVLLLSKHEYQRAYRKDFRNPLIKRLRRGFSDGDSAQRINIDACELLVKDILKHIARKGDFNVLITQGVQGRISASLSKASLKQAMDNIADSNAVTYAQIDNNVLVVPASEYQEFFAERVFEKKEEKQDSLSNKPEIRKIEKDQINFRDDTEFNLRGIEWIGEGAANTAFIEGNKTQLTLFLEEGDQFTDYTLKNIFQDYVILTKKGQEILLKLNCREEQEKNYK